MEESMQVEKPSEIQIVANNINKGLEAFETRKAELIQLKEDATGLTIESIEDKQAINQVSLWRKKLKAARVEIEKEGKSMRDPLTKIGKSILEKQYELIDIIGPTEQELQKKEDWVKSENLKIEQEEQKKEEVRIQTRIDRLAEYGYAIDLTLLKGIDDEIFEKTVESARVEWQKEQDTLAQEERKQQEAREQAERDRLELNALREKQEEADRILKERQDELDRQAKQLKQQQEEAAETERKIIHAELERRTDGRINQLSTLGFDHPNKGVWVAANRTGVNLAEIETLPDEQWDAWIEKCIPLISEFKDRQAKEAEEKRIQDIEDAKQQAIADEKERQRLADLKVAEDKRLADIKKQEDLEKAGDKAKWADFISKLAEIPVPAMRSNQYRKIAAITREKIEEIQKLKP